METTKNEHVKISLTKYHELLDTIDNQKGHINDLHEALKNENKVYELIYFSYFGNRYTLKDCEDTFITKSDADAKIQEMQKRISLIPKWIRLLFHKD